MFMINIGFVNGKLFETNLTTYLNLVNFKMLLDHSAVLHLFGRTYL